MVKHLLHILGLDRDRVDWARLADRQARKPRPVDPELRDRAHHLNRHLSRFLQASDPWMLRPGGLCRGDLPPGTDWHWRPCLLRGRISPAAIAAPGPGQPLGEDAALWHDCGHRALILRQKPCSGRGRDSGYALQIEALGFSGSFLSLALDLPSDALDRLGPDRILRVDAVMDAERPLTVYARINLVQGPNTETALRQLGHQVQGQGARRGAEFDLAYVGLANRPVDRAWLDLILESPRMNALTLCDAVVSHHPRAQA